MDYSASFTSGGILFTEFEAILPHLSKKNVKILLNKEIKENKYLKINTESARKRIAQEIIKRVEVANENFWAVYKDKDNDEKKIMLFHLCLKTYQLVWDFHFKVTIPGYWAYHHQLDDFAYKMYLDELTSKDDQVNSWSDNTKRKCVTNYLRMLKESGLVVSGKLQKPDLDNEFYCYFIQSNDPWALDAALLNVEEKKQISNYCK